MTGTRKQSRVPELCAYCGLRQGATRDHVPPKSIFPQDWRENLVTVPCCEPCRTLQQLDDQYFQTVVMLRSDVVAHPVGGLVLDTIHKALARPEQRGFTVQLLRSARRVALHSQGGIYLGHAVTYDVDNKRIDHVIQRTLRGLHFRKTGVRLLEETHKVTVFSIDGFAEAEAEYQETVRRLVGLAVRGESRIFAEGVFKYWVEQLTPDATLWLFSICDRVHFIGLAEPVDPGAA